MFSEYSITFQGGEYALSVESEGYVAGQKYDYVTDQSSYPCSAPDITSYLLYTYSGGTEYDLMTTATSPITVDSNGWI